MRSTRTAIVALLTDFGLRDWFVAALKGVILSRAPHVFCLDITHEIPPHDVSTGAFILAAAFPWLPQGTVVVAVVDPGVGSPRPLLAARVDGRYVLGPDNGLLSLCFQQGRRISVVKLTNRSWWLTPVSQTFQGRDILAPVAAYLARGGAFSALGPPVRRVRNLTLPKWTRTARGLRGQIVFIDRFGNAITNLPRAILARVAPAGAPRVRAKGRVARVVSSYADGKPGEVVALIGSLGVVELAARKRRAAQILKLKPGDPVEVVGPTRPPRRSRDGT